MWKVIHTLGTGEFKYIEAQQVWNITHEQIHYHLYNILILQVNNKAKARSYMYWESRTVCDWLCVVFVYQACDRDVQCGVGLCCAVSLWLRGLRMCTPQGLEGDECHPYSHKVYTNTLTHRLYVAMKNPSGIWKQWFNWLTQGNPRL